VNDVPINDDFRPKTITWSVDSEAVVRASEKFPGVREFAYAVAGDYAWMRIVRGSRPVEYTPVAAQAPRRYSEFPVFEDSEMQRWSNPRC
jgi:hypothetical protein